MGLKSRSKHPRAGAVRKTPHVKVRQLRKSDYEALCELQLACFPGMKPWLREQVHSMIDTFPEGQLCVEYQGKLAASSSSLIVDFDLYTDWHNWGEIADNGYIRNHDPEGDTLYGIEIMVHPRFRGYRFSRRLYEERKVLARRKNLARIMIGGRIPGYGAHADELSAEEYVRKVVAKELYDPVLTAQLANDFELKSLISNYLPGDEESMGYATFLEWTNLAYRSQRQRRLLPVQTVRVAAVQYAMRRVGSFEEFAGHVQFFADSAADYKADFLVFPELFTAQLLSFVPSPRPGLAARKLAEFTEQYLELFSRLAIKYNVNIVGGSQFVVGDDGSLYNVAHLFMRDGTIARQPKIHITPDESHWWGVTGGDKLEVFDTDRGKVAILICYDVEFPELVRIAARKGAKILFVPFNTDDRSGYLRVRYCSQARAIENHVYVVTAGCTGNLPEVENADVHYAQSAIYTPSDVMFARDAIAAETTPNVETVIVQDIDVEAVRRHRYEGTTLNWSDRRKDLYRVRYKEDGEEREI